jgi:hypothetical protein
MNWSIIVGNGKTFSAGILLIAAGVLSWLGLLPPQLHLDVSPLTAVASGVGAIGLGAKLQAILLNAQKP